MSSTKYTLGELLAKGLQYDSSWAIYSHGTGADSPARIGQTQFKQGGLLDGMEKVIDGVALGDAMLSYTEDCDEDYEIDGEEFLDWLIEDGWIEYSNPECYQDDPGCPSCGGCMFGADFPNGDNHGSCLVCGESYVWDNDEAEWVAK
jgi:hypothetical protein